MIKGILYGSVLCVTFILTVISSKMLIPCLKSKKMGQKILEIGPRWHKNKEGTPTMGGLAFIGAIILTLAVALPTAYFLNRISAEGIQKAVLVLSFALVQGLIGVVDDLAKFKKGKNQGLTASQKYLLQLFSSCLFLVAGVYFGLIAGRAGDALYIPFIGNVYIFGSAVGRIIYYVISLLLLTGVVNAVNLTDGIDGLSSSVTLVVALSYTVYAVLISDSSVEIQLLSAALIGGTAGFLVYNFYPAKVFMGDTGSLFLGGMVVGMAFVLKSPFLILIFGLVYIAETLSVILQVSYFKLTNGKRLFKMSPIHHHFEKCGWSEIKIVSVFSFISLIAGAVGILEAVL